MIPNLFQNAVAGSNHIDIAFEVMITVGVKVEACRFPCSLRDACSLIDQKQGLEV